MEKTIFDAVIIGAGVIGLAIAKHLSEEGMQVVVLEKAERSGESTSSRNSGVIHAGMYYPVNSLKAKLCVEGNSLLYDYAKKKNISFKKIGKYIVSTNKSEQKKLDHIYENGRKNLFSSERDEKIKKLMQSIDNTNYRYGRSTLSLASAGVHKKWNMRRQYSSKIDTADFYCLPTIRAI